MLMMLIIWEVSKMGSDKKRTPARWEVVEGKPSMDNPLIKDILLPLKNELYRLIEEEVKEFKKKMEK